MTTSKVEVGGIVYRYRDGSVGPFRHTAFERLARWIGRVIGVAGAVCSRLGLVLAQIADDWGNYNQIRPIGLLVHDEENECDVVVDTGKFAQARGALDEDMVLAVYADGMLVKPKKEAKGGDGDVG